MSGVSLDEKKGEFSSYSRAGMFNEDSRRQAALEQTCLLGIEGGGEQDGSSITGRENII